MTQHASKRAVFRGCRYTAWHVDDGPPDTPLRQVRTWTALRRLVGHVRQTARETGRGPDRIVLRATDTRGRTWRPLTPVEMMLYRDLLRPDRRRRPLTRTRSLPLFDAARKRPRRCDYCTHAGYRNSLLVRCKYPRPLAPEVVDLTDIHGHTRIWAAEVCPAYTPRPPATARKGSCT